MKREELQTLIDRVRKRHNRRVIALVALLLVVVFGGFRLNDYLNPVAAQTAARESFFQAVIVYFLLIAILGGVFILRRAKSDCYRYGVLCPKCGHHLYSRRRLLLGGRGTRETGLCPHCQAQLIDDAVT